MTRPVTAASWPTTALATSVRTARSAVRASASDTAAPEESADAPAPDTPGPAAPTPAPCDTGAGVAIATVVAAGSGAAPKPPAPPPPPNPEPPSPKPPAPAGSSCVISLSEFLVTAARPRLPAGPARSQSPPGRRRRRAPDPPQRPQRLRRRGPTLRRDRRRNVARRGHPRQAQPGRQPRPRRFPQRPGRPVGDPAALVQPRPALRRLGRAHRHRHPLGHDRAEAPRLPQGQQPDGEHQRQRAPAPAGRQHLSEALVPGRDRVRVRPVGQVPHDHRVLAEQPQRQRGVAVVGEAVVAERRAAADQHGVVRGRSGRRGQSVSAAGLVAPGGQPAEHLGVADVRVPGGRGVGVRTRRIDQPRTVRGRIHPRRLRGEHPRGLGVRLHHHQPRDRHRRQRVQLHQGQQPRVGDEQRRLAPRALDGRQRARGGPHRRDGDASFLQQRRQSAPAVGRSGVRIERPASVPAEGDRGDQRAEQQDGERGQRPAPRPKRGHRGSDEDGGEDEAEAEE